MATEILGKKPLGADQKDPVCSMSVTSDSAYRKMEQGKTYYFCSQACQKEFESDPSLYTGTKQDE